MKVENNKVVTMTYTLHFNDEQGEIIQKVDDSKPFVQMFGAGALLPAFESNLAGMKKGDNFGFHLKAEDAYGKTTEEAILELDRKIFEVDGKIDPKMVAEGKMITMQDQHDNPIDGKVMAIKEDKVLMDFNHPLAGEDLYFEGNIIDIREASEEELSHGHAHDPEGHHHH